MTEWRNSAVTAAIIVAALTATANAKPLKTNKHQHQVSRVECFTDEDRRGGRQVCTGAAQIASLGPARAHRGRARATAPAQSHTVIAAFGGSSLVAEARRHIGATAAQLGLRRSLWCAAFIDKVVLPNTGHSRLHSDVARDFARYGRRVSGPQVGALAVMKRSGGGHIGVVSGIESDGDVRVISGNFNGRVQEAVYPRSRVIAYVVPNA